MVLYPYAYSTAVCLSIQYFARSAVFAPDAKADPDLERADVIAYRISSEA